jgi:hypothetical protein
LYGPTWSDPSRIAQKVWSCCSVLRDCGLSCLDDIEQITGLPFLEMMDERAARAREAFR